MNNFTSLCLKVVGVILIVSALIDYIVLAIPFQPLEASWQIAYIGTVVDRGIIPMVGIAFLLSGYWVDSVVSKKNAGLDLKLPVFIFSTVLGLVFLLFVPLYLNNLRTISNNALEQITERAAQVENRLQTEFDQLNALLQNQEQLQQLDQRIAQIDRAIQTGQFQGQTLNAQQKQQLEQQKQRLENISQLRDQPEKLEERLSELQNQLRSRQQERENRAKTETFKRGVRIGLSSLMLAGGYSIIGWLGLKGAGGSKAPRSKPGK